MRTMTAERSRWSQALVDGAVAGVLARGAAAVGVGLCGVLAYLVTQRTKKSASAALGSSTGACSNSCARLLLLAAGLATGVAGAVGISRALEGQLFGVHATDPLVAVLAIVTLGLVALAACALPARRATRIDPVIALAE